MDAELYRVLGGRMKELISCIGELLDCLPDSNKWEHDETWEWCWNELSDEAQERVVLIRRKGVELLLILNEILDLEGK